MSFHLSFLFGRSSLLYVSPCWKAMVCLPLPVSERQELLLYTGRQHIRTSFCNSLSDAPVGLCLLSEWHKKWGTRRILLRLQKRPYPRASEDLALLFLLKDSHCKPTANIVLNGEKLKTFPLRSGTRQKNLLIISMQNSSGHSSQDH